MAGFDPSAEGIDARLATLSSVVIGDFRIVRMSVTKADICPLKWGIPNLALELGGDEVAATHVGTFFDVVPPRAIHPDLGCPCRVQTT